MRKILYVSGTRADYGLMRRTLFAIKKHPKLEIEIVVTGMHLMAEFGKTINEIKKDNFKIHEIRTIYRKDNKESMANFVGELISGLTKRIKKIKPDIILLLGDRAEMLGGAVVGNYLTIPVAHIHGGEITSTVDEVSRQAITKLSHIHFPATKKSAQRIIKMGEGSRRVYLVGAPGLDDVSDKKLFSRRQTAKKYNLDLLKPIVLVIQHPVTAQASDAPRQIRQTLLAVKELGFQTIIVYPNADAGGRSMIKVIEQYRKEPFIQIHKSIPRKDYLSLLKIADVMVGNSSSGIIETPSFHLPAVNIGERQEGREEAGNVINVGYNRNEIKKAITKAICGRKVKKYKNPYSGGKAGLKIVKILSSIKIDKKLLNKKLTY